MRGGPALSMPWATARSNSPCAVVSRSGGACTGGCGTAVQVICEACSGFVTFWSPSAVLQAVLGNHCAQSPASSLSSLLVLVSVVIAIRCYPSNIARTILVFFFPIFGDLGLFSLCVQKTKTSNCRSNYYEFQKKL